MAGRVCVGCCSEACDGATRRYIFEPVCPSHRNDDVKMVVVRDGDVPSAGDSGCSDDGPSHSEG